MPFSQVTCLLQLLDIWLSNGWEVELCCRCLFFLLRVHHHQLVTNSTLLPIMDSLKQHTSQQVSQIKVTRTKLVSYGVTPYLSFFIPSLLHDSLSLSLSYSHTFQDMYGVNLAGLQYLQLELDKKGTHVFGDAPELIRKRRKLTT